MQKDRKQKLGGLLERKSKVPLLEANMIFYPENLRESIDKLLELMKD